MSRISPLGRMHRILRVQPEVSIQRIHSLYVCTLPEGEMNNMCPTVISHVLTF